ncbi:trihelix transcription factor GT-3a [Fundulus heteroclitus]|uniref:trihelix transcription factor GT-3a n=1 Tax=Fundulus heteroclitus TaxID=8078 RepID=UPI00165CB89D|nr:trihelix transcription factor GT-3a [Fundulus heteroclitus]
MASKERGATWDDAETEAVITIWAEDAIQAMLEGAKHNHRVFQKISDEMKARGYVRDPKQCREKIKKLRTQYKKVLDHNNRSGSGKKTWKFYSAMDEVLSVRASSRTPVLLKTSTLNSAATKDDDATSDNEEQYENQYSTQDEMDDEQSLNGSIASFFSEEPGGSRIAEVPAAEAPEVNIRPEKKIIIVKALDSIIKEFVKAQRRSDDPWMAAFKEQQESVQRHQQHQLNMIREIERNRLQAEERMRKQEQEHEMRLMQMMVQLMSQQPAQLQPLNPASPSSSFPNFSNYGPYE